MNRLHRVRKSECDRVSAWLCNDGERPKVSLCKFPRGPSSAEVLGFDKSLVTDFEVQCQSLSSVRRSLVLQLCSSHLLTEELVEGVEIDRVVIYESLIKVHKPKEGLYILDLSRLGPVLYGLHLLQRHSKSRG